MNLFDTILSGRERHAEAFAEHTQIGINRILNVSSAIPGAAATEPRPRVGIAQEGSSPRLADLGTAEVGRSSERAMAECHLGKQIVTVHVFPPIPCRRNDWCAYPDGEEENGNYGWGPTEAAAIADLIEILRDDERLPIRGAL